MRKLSYSNNTIMYKLRTLVTLKEKSVHASSPIYAVTHSLDKSKKQVMKG